jgi:hypothetical protein
MVIRVAQRQLKVGTRVRVPWGLEGDVEGRIVDVWGDPPEHVRVQLVVDGEEDAEPVVLLLSPSALDAA